MEALILGDKAQNVGDIDRVNGVKLGQNRPNPTGAGTTIDYVLPKDMTNANLVVIELNGRTVNKQAITNQSGVVELNTSTWASGTYIYSIKRTCCSAQENDRTVNTLDYSWSSGTFYFIRFTYRIIDRPKEHCLDICSFSFIGLFLYLGIIIEIQLAI